MPALFCLAGTHVLRPHVLARLHQFGVEQRGPSDCSVSCKRWESPTLAEIRVGLRGSTLGQHNRSDLGLSLGLYAQL